MRRFGIGTLGGVAGLFVALVITDFVAGAAVVGGDADPPVVLGLLLGFLPLLCAALGAVAALVTDTVTTRRAGAPRRDRERSGTSEEEQHPHGQG